MAISKTKKELLNVKFDCCVYCGSKDSKTIDHLIPKSKGGTDYIDNLVICCKSCNSRKKDKSIEDFRFSEALSKTKYEGIINYKQAKELISIGVDLDIDASSHKFYMER